jgi:hypothetical protein
MGGGAESRKTPVGAAQALGLPPELVQQLADYQKSVSEAADEDPEYDGAWPENVRAISIFAYMRGQWRMSMNGPIALDMSVLEACSRAAGCSKMAGFREIDKLHVMEGAALEWIRKSE